MAGFGSRGGLRIVGVVRKDTQEKPTLSVQPQPDNKEKVPTPNKPRS